jgi:tripeptide aminopeptidase
VEKKYPKSDLSIEIKESYRNMKIILDKHTQVVDYAMEAVARTGLKPVKNLIRGGTDGAGLCFMGVPTPNIFTGGHNFHSKKEWISVQNMAKAVETIICLSEIWAEKSK